MWKPCPVFVDRYEVSDAGQIRNIQTGRVRRLRPSNKGYFVAIIYRDRAFKTVSIHRMVALAFLGPPPFEDALVGHKDNIKTNNAIENLEWCSHGENTRHFYNGFYKPIKRSAETKRKMSEAKRLQWLNGVYAHRKSHYK
jgi:hypothetical protein